MNGIDLSTKLNDSSCASLVQNGISHVGRYLANSWKGLTLDEIASIKKAGLQLFSIFEKGATQSDYFTKEQGVDDANTAYQLAQSFGQPEQTAIYFAVDFDAQTKDFAGILNYFQGVNDTLTSYKIGVYGKYEVIQLIQSKKLADYYFQTYAWSHGLHAKGIHLFQYQNDISKFGLQVDLVNVENADCGSWLNTSVETKVDSEPSTFLMTVKVLTETDVRDQPSHSGGFIKNAHKDEEYNVIQIVNDWHEVALDDKTKGWIDGNNGQNLYWLDNPALNPQTQKYILKSGDTLTKVAKIFKTSVDYLMKINPSISNPNKIYVGQTINIPKQ
jgi:hypothetical protein